jgi:hypothetical protein
MGDSIRESLEEAVAATPVEEKAVEKIAAKPEVVEPEKVTEKAEPEKDGAVETTSKPVLEEKAPEEEKKPEVEDKVRFKPPAAWRAGAKERWATLPPDVQEEVTRRERESSIAIQQNAESRHQVDAFNQMIAPYRSVMAAEGTNDPIVAVQNLMQTATTLRLGTPMQKADLIARLINVYGVDVQTLDGLLSGQANPQVQEQDRIERLLQERLAPYQQFMQEQQSYRQQQTGQLQSEAARAIDAFMASPEAEFASDPEVAATMADLLDVASRRNRSMSMKEAYTQACNMNPEISKILAQRTAALKAPVDINRAKNAASSVVGGPMGGGPATSGSSIRDSILAAMDRNN